MAQTLDPELLEKAHKLSIGHRAEIEASAKCGCFYCGNCFKSSEVNRWTDDGQTALCPSCDIDSVIGDKSLTLATDADFLSQMHLRWFGNKQNA
jgi:Zn finger protein HypA/HybF involved in hydrogenase expression